MPFNGAGPQGSASVSVHAKLLDLLGRSIVRGELQPGDPLPNADDWSAAHGVSRTALREVIKVLAGKGMVEARPKTGTRIRARTDWNFLDPDILAWRYGPKTTFEEAQSLFELRRAIEPSAGAIAAQRATKEQIATLEKIYEKMERFADDNERFAEADLEFHQSILHMTGNELFGSLASLTATAMLISFKLSDDNPYGQRPSLPLHWGVYEAIAQRDPEAARSRLIELLDLAEEDVNRSLAARKARGR
ncbi:GntR family transcriptional regulator [Xaviernesmea oryzae]|uniref:GntR family transcriptional regulator n=1 Tax=Xaviernesmea oryzae TaxID=464029 RepID=A0A1Q9AS99_9HYPH|nr:FadR/GntR family transcriptional regulator [Xaviernesmea oryzae]OLP58297.1 GntR family transcriptional regulator [Xaviernesmea oryzae]SEL43009.1 DNA-binding transcriptional regulator, FadR family [Xaviernesmea oryzae]